MSKRVQFNIWLDRGDKEALEFIQITHSVTMSAAARICIKAAARQLGFAEKKQADTLEILAKRDK